MGLAGRLDQQQVGVAQGARRLELRGEMFVEIILHSRDQFEGDARGCQLPLQSPDRVLDLPRCGVVAAADAVRRAVNAGIAGARQEAGHGQRLVERVGAVVDVGEKVAVVVCQTHGCSRERGG